MSRSGARCSRLLESISLAAFFGTAGPVPIRDPRVLSRGRRRFDPVRRDQPQFVRAAPRCRLMPRLAGETSDIRVQSCALGAARSQVRREAPCGQTCPCETTRRYNHLPGWLQDVRDQGWEHISIVAVGNKAPRKGRIATPAARNQVNQVIPTAARNLFRNRVNYVCELFLARSCV